MGCSTPGPAGWRWSIWSGPGRMPWSSTSSASPAARGVGRPDPRAAFFEGYGRELADKEARSLRCLAALDAVSAISWGAPHRDPEIVARGRATLARLERGDAA